MVRVETTSATDLFIIAHNTSFRLPEVNIVFV